MLFRDGYVIGKGFFIEENKVESLYNVVCRIVRRNDDVGWRG